MCRLNYQQLKKMHDDAYWAQQKAWEDGLFGLAIKYCKIAIRLHNAMMSFPAENITRSTQLIESSKKILAR